jgi:hypothetical protein
VAVVGVIAQGYTWIAVVLGLLGAVFLLYGSMPLIIESRLALGAITSEMDFVQKVSRKHGQGLDDLRAGPMSWLGRKIG